jgi:hypothetical protein
MDRACMQILGRIAELEAANPGTDVDEYGLARALELIPPSMPAHVYTISPIRAGLLPALDRLDQRKLVYATRNGFWRLRLTPAGRVWLAEGAALAPLGPAPRPPARAPSDAAVWQRPRLAGVPPGPHTDRFTSLALAAATLVAFSVVILSSLAGGSAAPSVAAKPDASPAMSGPPTVLPLAQAPEPAPPTPTAPPPAKRRFVVANTDGDGVYLRRSPQLRDRLSAWPDGTPLAEIGPDVNAGGLTWFHVRAPDGSEGYVPADYAKEAH